MTLDPEYMCPNCVTPWKCNGPHIPEGIITYANTSINQGGLMRCCLETLYNWLEERLDEPIEEGKIISCAYETVEKDQMILKGTTWIWNRP